MSNLSFSLFPATYVQSLLECYGFIGEFPKTSNECYTVLFKLLKNKLWLVAIVKHTENVAWKYKI